MQELMAPPNRISRLGLVNCYLVAEDEGLTLIDTMLPGSAKPILAAAESAGAPIVRILLTHAHGDHVGALDKLRAALPKTDVIVSERDARPLDGDSSLDPGEPKDKLRGWYPRTETRPNRLISAGDRVGSLEAVAAPGHTPGQLAFLDLRDGTLYCGDAFSTLGGVATSAGANPRFPLPALATWHKPTALESARSLAALNPKALAPGHGKVVENPTAAMAEAIAKAESSTEETR